MLEEGGGLRRLASLRPRKGGEVVMLSSTLSEDDDDDGGDELDHSAYAAHASTGETGRPASQRDDLLYGMDGLQIGSTACLWG